MVYKKIPFALPDIDEQEIQEVTDTLKSGWLTTGKKVSLFEHDLAVYSGCKHVIAVSSCTAALHVSLVALGIGTGDEVITTPFTFVSTVEAIIHVGAIPVLVDIEADTLNIDPKKIVEKITPRTKAIIPVHYGGHPCDMDAIYAIAKQYNVCVVDDAAHAIGAKYKQKKIGALSSDTTCFSFYATKNVAMGEGGAVATDNDELAQKIRHLALHGITHDAWARYGDNADWHYDLCAIGYKYNLTDIQASIGIHQLRKLDGMNAKRREYAAIYSQVFSRFQCLQLPIEKDDCSSAYHLYPVRVQVKGDVSCLRDSLIMKLKEAGISTSVHFIPVCSFKLMQEHFGFREDDYPVAMEAFAGIVSLPIYSSMPRDDVMYVADTVSEIVSCWEQ